MKKSEMMRRPRNTQCAEFKLYSSFILRMEIIFLTQHSDTI